MHVFAWQPPRALNKTKTDERSNNSFSVVLTWDPTHTLLKTWYTLFRLYMALHVCVCLALELNELVLIPDSSRGSFWDTFVCVDLNRSCDLVIFFELFVRSVFPITILWSISMKSKVAIKSQLEIHNSVTTRDNGDRPHALTWED